MRLTPIAAALLATAGWLPAGPADAGGARASAHVVFYADTANTVPGSASVRNLPRVRPFRVVMFEDGSWIIDKLHWSRWGGAVARATGISSASNCKPNCAEGKRTHNPVRLVLSHRRHLLGHLVYTCYQLTDPKAPQSNQHLCLERIPGKNQYAYGPAPGAPLHLSSFLSPDRTIWCTFQNLPGFRQADCFYTDNPSAARQEYAAALHPNGQVLTCAWQPSQPGLDACVQNWDPSATALKSGQVNVIYQYRCTATPTTVTCTVDTGAGKGKGFTISHTGVTPVP